MSAQPKPKLHVVGSAGTVDIYGAWRAEIKARDWARCHVAADRRSPIFLSDGQQRTRAGEPIVVRSQGGAA